MTRLWYKFIWHLWTILSPSSNSERYELDRCYEICSQVVTPLKKPTVKITQTTLCSLLLKDHRHFSLMSFLVNENMAFRESLKECYIFPFLFLEAIAPHQSMTLSSQFISLSSFALCLMTTVSSQISSFITCPVRLSWSGVSSSSTRQQQFGGKLSGRG